MTGFEPATTRPPDAYSNRAELHPALFCVAKVRIFYKQTNMLIKYFLIYPLAAPCLIPFLLTQMPVLSKKRTFLLKRGDYFVPLQIGGLISMR